MFAVQALETDHLTWKGGGGYGFLFRSEIFLWTTQELECLFFLSRKSQFFFPEFNIRLYDKNSWIRFFFFLHQNQNIFLEKKPYPPFKLNMVVPLEIKTKSCKHM